MNKYPVAEVPKNHGHQYIIAVRGGRMTHMWTLKDDQNAVHIHAWRSPGFASYGPEWMGGVEVHASRPFGYSSEKPDQEHCWLLRGPCWHDGTSLYFSERIAPMLERIEDDAPMPAHIHSYMLSELRYWLRTKFENEDERVTITDARANKEQ